MEKMKATPKITVIIFSLLGVGILYGISLTSFVEPPYVPLEEIVVGTHEGAFVCTEGVITDFSVTEYGNMLTIKRNKTELLIFVDSADERKEQLNLSYGDEIEVQGRVQLYRGRYEIVASENSIKKLSDEKESTISFVSQIAMHPEEYEGRRISVVGYAEDVYKHVFYLGDEKGKYLMRVKVNNGSIPISELQKGDKIIAEGLLSYDPENMRYELNLISLRQCDNFLI
jgi:DNA/RNA endonuclease YhcR with UshA esterase domain